jgi:hypothetical protein
MTPLYCGTCGTGLGESAKFCRACGSAQATAAPQPARPAAGYQPQPPSPYQPAPAAFAPSAARPLSALEVGAAVLAIVGGAAICFVALYAVIYLPLHHDFAINYGESVRIGDVLALASGLAAIVVGLLLLTRRGGSATASGIWLVAAGTPTLIVALLWSFPETFHLSIFPVPFYFAYVYFTDLGVVHIGDGYVPLPLVIGCALVIAAGFVVISPSLTRTAAPAGRR